MFDKIIGCKKELQAKPFANLVEKQIRINAVAPGPIWTPFIAASFKP